MQGFGLAVGSDLYYLVDQGARKAALSVATQAANVTMGTLAMPGNTTLTGFFTLTASSFADEAAFSDGSATCGRHGVLPWWQQSANPYWAFLLVPMFAIALSLWNLQPLRTRQFPVMVTIACAGYAANRLANACKSKSTAIGSQAEDLQTSSSAAMSSPL
jgi:hypothetical protein